MKFEPIAIIGRGCVLPGCQSPDSLWETIHDGQIQISAPPVGSWRINTSRVLEQYQGRFRADKAWSDRGGYIHDFGKHFDSGCSLLDSNLLGQLDPLVQWSVYAGKQAIDDHGRLTPKQRKNTGVILGNLSYPSSGHSRFAESVLLKKHLGQHQHSKFKSNYLDRFNSGLPAMLLAKALGLEAGSFALDAACASGLYAIKLACDRLQNRSADQMLAGAVNAADPLFIHVGFSALNALSISGQSRPFHRDADGLIPAEGAAFVLLKRLEDAVREGDNIAGVIHGIGLSNDGRTGGFLSPSVEGQVRCLEQAYESASISPEKISYVECHATGTPTGDAAEIKSMSAVFKHELPLGSLKTNLGHLITTSGVAGLLKVLGGMEHGLLPATPATGPISETLEKSTFRIQEKPEPWVDETGLWAGVSSFGFGGNNAHLIVSTFEEKDRTTAFPGLHLGEKKEIAVVAMEVKTHLNKDIDSFSAMLFEKQPWDEHTSPIEDVSFTAKDLAFPPADLKQALGQQLLLLKTAQSALRKTVALDSTQTGVYIGMATDSEIGRLGLRLRLRDLISSAINDEPWLEKAENAISSTLTAAGVVGKMPNIPANRLSNQFDFQGPGFTVSREELSGDTALELAINAMNRGEINTAIVGAVDLSRETVHQTALEEIHTTSEGGQNALDFDIQSHSSEPADAAVVLILKEYQAALEDGDVILAVLDQQNKDGSFCFGNTDPRLSEKLGHAHAASGLLHHAAAISMLHARQTISYDARGSGFPLFPRGQDLSLQVQNKTTVNESSSLTYRSGHILTTKNKALISTFAANSQRELIHQIEKKQMSREGNYRCAIVGSGHDLNEKQEQAVYLLKNGKIHDGWNKNGIFYRSAPLQGEMAFTFTGAASAYPQMGKALFKGLPVLSDMLQKRLKNVDEAIGWAFCDNDPRADLPYYQLAGSSVICQAHAMISREFFGLEPQAALGLSSGETNALFAFDAWSDIDGLFEDIGDSRLYDQALGGDFQAVQHQWCTTDPIQWDNWRLLAPVLEVKQAIQKEEKVYLTIINTDSDCVIGGERDGCQRILDQFKNAQALPLGHDIAVHCEVVNPFKNQWHRIHSRPTVQPKGVRFYSNFFGNSYTLSQNTVAGALTGQAVETVDFPKTIKRAWKDGVRIFLEHGPRNSLCTAIDQILKDKPHCAIPMDRMGVNSYTQIHSAAAELWCAGVEVDLDKLAQLMGSLRIKPSGKAKKEPSISFRLRPEIGVIEPIQLPEVENTLWYIPPVHCAGPVEAQIMVPAPLLARLTSVPSVLPPETLEEETRLNEPEALPKIPVRQESPHTLDVRGEERSQDKTSVRSDGLNDTAHIENTSRRQSPVDLIVASHRQLVEGHKHYLKKQEEAFQQYTALMQKMQNSLLSKVTGTDMGSMDLAWTPPLAVEIKKKQPLLDQNKLVETIPEPSSIAVKYPANVDKNYSAVRASVEIQRPGPKIDRQQLITLSSGKISSILGPVFELQDEYAIQVRMPEPPLLLCDRVLGIEGEPGKLGTGTIWTETDVLENSWYLHHGRMPSGIFIEAGQADLLLISWLGIDFINRGKRAYRLLGCELVFHGDLPKPGDTLSYEIKVDGHAKQGDVRLFFFHYDCTIDGKKRISVRHGQAGFFSIGELEDSSGVLWQADQAEYTANPSLSAHPVLSHRTRFTKEQVIAYTEGDLVSCFGPDFYRANTHTRSARSPGGKYNFIGEVTAFEPTGGPAGRGYLRAESPVHPSDWFFEGHFKNDPCMPGTLMADACLQMMAFYMTATGRTLHRDGWRFQPAQDTKYLFVCRGQVLPESKHLTYEVFVDEIIDGDESILFAHVLCSVDGRKAFLCERFGLQLVPDWPIDDLIDWSKEKQDTRPLAHIDAFPLDKKSLLSCAWGKPSHAFGEGFNHFDGTKRAPRLPGPPYHFMTRIASLTGTMGAMATGSTIEVLYDIPEDAWYFRDNATATMPFCVLMELALQPCGWLSSYSLSPEASRNELLFRNLDGNLKMHREILPHDETIHSHVTLSSLSKAGEMIILSFLVVCRIDDEIVAEMDTVFGFFPPETMRTQKGLQITEADREIRDIPCDFHVSFDDKTGTYFDRSKLKIPSSKLLMLDEITGYWPEGGQKKQGAIRAVKNVRPEEWFFKAHFFQDPVQPGSLGIEAMLQLIQVMMLEKNAGEGIDDPRFEPIHLAGKIEWHYRGQVIPENKKVTIVFEASEWGNSPEGSYVIGAATYWVDSLKIYHSPEIGMRIVASKDPKPHVKPVDWVAIRNYWITKNQMEHRFIHDFSSGLIRQYVHQTVFENDKDFEKHIGKPVLFLANHETSVESFLFLTIMGELAETDIKAISKSEHRDSWIGAVDQVTQSSLGPQSGVGIMFFDRDKPAQLPGILRRYAMENEKQPTSLLVHTDGTRATFAGQQVENVSAIFLDCAIQNRLPIIPVCFTGGLPEEPGDRLDVPSGSQGQNFVIGTSIDPALLERMPLNERGKFVLDRMNQLLAAHFVVASGESVEHGVPLSERFKAILKSTPDICDETQKILDAKDRADLSSEEEIAIKLISDF